MVTATNQGHVTATRLASPHRRWSRSLGGTGQPNHQAVAVAAAMRAGPTGPFVRIARLRQIQKLAAADRDARRPRTQRLAWQPSSQSASVASVVASFDSTTTIGAVA